MKHFAPLTALLVSSASVCTAQETLTFYDTDSALAYAQLSYTDGQDGTLTLRDRWCASDSRICPEKTETIPAQFIRLFDADTKAPVPIKLESGITLTLNPLFGFDAELAGPDKRHGGETSRMFEIRTDAGPHLFAPPVNGGERIALHAEDGRTLTLHFRPDEATATPDLRGWGAVIALPDAWCGTDDCAGFTFEAGADLLRQWADGAFGAGGMMTLYHDDIELTLGGSAGAIWAELGQTRYAQTTSPDMARSFDCEPTGPTIGSVTYFITRGLDDACIGRVSWPVVPDPLATLSLMDGWCGNRACAAVTLTSDSFEGEGLPTRFGGAMTNGPSLTILAGAEGWSAPVALSSDIGRAIVKIEPDIAEIAPIEANSGPVYRLDEIPGPRGVYALLEGVSATEEVGHRGDTMCITKPVVFVGRGLILLKEMGAPENGNPYHIKQYLECSSWDGGPENCVFHEGTPDAPNPVASSGGYDYTPIGNGDFQMCPQDGQSACARLYSCVREGGEITFDREFPSGGNMVEAMLSLWDGSQPDFEYIDNSTIRFKE